MMEKEQLKPYIGRKVTMAGHELTFEFSSDMGGVWNVFVEKDGLWIYATLNYEMRGLPVAVHDSEGEFIDCDAYEGEVKDWEHYLQLTTQMVEKILKKQLNKE